MDAERAFAIAKQIHDEWNGQGSSLMLAIAAMLRRAHEAGRAEAIEDAALRAQGYMAAKGETRLAIAAAIRALKEAPRG